jgi:hypothetical protein
MVKAGYPPEQTDTGVMTGTGVGADSKMWHLRNDGVHVASMFAYFTCGTIHNWFPCSAPDAPEICDCITAIGC